MDIRVTENTPPAAPAKKGPPCTRDDLKRARQWLRQKLPDRDTPLTVGIWEDLLAIKPFDLPEAALRVVLRERVADPRYLVAMLVSRERQGLNGKRETIAEEHRLHAADRLLRLAADGVLDCVFPKNKKPHG